MQLLQVRSKAVIKEKAERFVISDKTFGNMRKGGLEPPRGNPHYHLKVARLPIPPLSQDVN